MQVGISFDDAVHGFRPGRGTDTVLLHYDDEYVERQVDTESYS
jgi:hypothetical protein